VVRILPSRKAFSDLECRCHFKRFRRADPLGVATDFLGRAAGELGEATAVAQEVAGDFESVFSGIPVRMKIARSSASESDSNP
jgi:hypothetical protein